MNDPIREVARKIMESVPERKPPLEKKETTKEVIAYSFLCGTVGYMLCLIVMALFFIDRFSVGESVLLVISGLGLLATSLWLDRT